MADVFDTIEEDAQPKTFQDSAGFESGVETIVPPVESGPSGIGIPQIMDDSERVDLDEIERYQTEAKAREASVPENNLSEEPVGISTLLGSKAYKDQKNPFKRIDALNIITNQGRGFLREASLLSDDYEATTNEYDRDYIGTRKGIVQDGVKRIVLGSEQPEALIKALNSGDASQLEGNGIREYQAAVNLHQYGDRINKPLGTFAFTAHGMQEVSSLGKNDAVIDGGVHIAQASDGGWEADVILPGLAQDKRKLVLNPDIPTQTELARKTISDLQAEKVIAEKELKESKAIAGLDSEYGWVRPAADKISIKGIDAKISEQEERLKWLSGDKKIAESYLAVEEVASKMKQDEAYMSKIGKGWLNPIAIGSQAVGGIVESFAFTGEVGSLAIGETADFFGLEGASEKGRQIAGDIRAAKEDIIGLEGVSIGGGKFGPGLGITKAQFRQTGADKFGLALVNEVPQLGIAAMTGQLPAWMGKKAIRQISKQGLKKGIREAGEKVTKETLTPELIMQRMIDNGADKFQQVAAKTISPATAALYGAGREGGGAWEQTMDFASNQLGRHKDLASLRNEQLTLEDLRDTEGANELKKRGDAYERAINNVGAHMAVTMGTVGATEFLPFLRVFKAGNRTGQQVFDSFVNLNIKQSDKLREAIAFSVDAIFEKGGMEGLQEALVNGSTKTFIDPEQGLLEGVPNAIGVGIVLGVAGNYAARRYSQEMTRSGVEGLVRGDLRQKELKGLAGGMVFENQDTGKFYVNDRQDQNEEFDSFEEAALFTPNRHGLRFQKFAAESLIKRGQSPEEAAASVVAADTLVRAVAKASGSTVNDTYALLNGEDILDQLPEPDLQTPEILGKVKLAEIGAPRAEFDVDQKRRKRIEAAFKKRAKAEDRKLGKRKALTPAEKIKIEKETAENPNKDLNVDNSSEKQAEINANKTRAVMSQMVHLNKIIDNEKLSDEVRQRAQEDFEALFDSEDGPGTAVLQKMDEFGEFFDRKMGNVSSGTVLPTPEVEQPVPVEPTQEEVASIEASLQEAFIGAENAFAERSEQAKTFIQDEVDLKRFDDITRFLETGKLTDEETSAMVAEQQEILDRNDLRPFETITTELGRLDAQLEKLESQDQTEEVLKKIAENQESQRGLRKSERQLFADEKSLKRAKDAKRRIKEKFDRTFRQELVSAVRSVVTPKQNAEYLAAVKDGDTATAGRMVDDAAKAEAKRRGATLYRAEHGTEAQQKFDVFDFNRAKQQEAGPGVYFGVGFEDSYSGENGQKFDSYIFLRNPYVTSKSHTSPPVQDKAIFDKTIKAIAEEHQLTDEETQQLKDEFLVPVNFVTRPNELMSAVKSLALNDGIDQEFKRKLDRLASIWGVTGKDTKRKIASISRWTGHDGIVYENSEKGGTSSKVIVAWEPSQIKLADPITEDASGEIIPLNERFNEKSDSILRQQGLNQGRPRGETEIITDEVTKQQKAIIRIFKEGDVSTFVHEVTHGLHQIKNEDGISLLSLAIGTDQTAEQFWDWATFNGQLSQDSREASERIASGIEAYLAEGIAPERSLDNVFRILSNAIRNVYANMINNSGVKLTKSARKGYDRLFAQSQETFFDSSTGKATQGGLSILGNPELRNLEAIPPSEIPPEGTPITMSNQPVTTDASGKPIGVTPTDPRTLVAGVGIRYDRKNDKLRKKSRAEQALRAILRPADSQERGILPTEAVRAMSEAQGLQESIIFQLEVLVKDTRQALNREYGVGLTNKATRDKRRKTERAINTYMVERDPSNESALLETMLPDTRAMSIRMKASITKLSNELIRAGVVDGNLAAIIQENVGAYLHRSYEVFENPDWSTRLRAGVDPRTGVKLNDNEWAIVNAAKAFFKTEFNAETELEQDQLINYFLNPANQTGGVVNSLDKSGLSRKNRSILKKRSDIAPEIQALWGVYDDPLINYSKTVLKMANLIATHKNLAGLKQAGLDNGWIAHPDDKTRDPRMDHRISSEGNKALEPLDGFYTTTDLAEVLFAGFSQQSIANQGQVASTYFALQRFNGAAKFSAIVLNPGTIARNYIGGMIMYYGNGYADPISVWKNFTSIEKLVDSPIIKGHRVGVKEFSRKGASDPITDTVAELIRLQVIDTNVVVSEFREVMGLVGESSTSEEFSEKLFGRAAQIAKSSVKRAGDFYRMGDSVWKAAAYFSELEMQVNANKDNVPLEELKRRAADRATDLMPSYSKAPDWVKTLSKFPITGLFVTFTAESIRISANQLKIGIKDLGTPEMRLMGAKRLGGLVISRGGGIKAAAHFLAGVSQFYDQDEEDIRKIGPHWFRVSDLVNFGENEKGQKLIGILDFVDPFAQLHNVVAAIKSVDKDNAFSVDMDAGLQGVGTEIFGPFLRPEIGTKALVNIANTFNADNVPQSMVTALTKDIWGAINPKGIPRTWRTFAGDTGDVPWDIALKGFAMGITPMPLDAEKSLSFASHELSGAISQSQKDFATNLKLPGATTESGVGVSMSIALAGRKAAFSKLTEQTYASIRQGMDEGVAFEILKGSLTQEQALHVINGTVPSIDLSRRDAVRIEKDQPGFINRLFQDGEVFVKDRGKVIDPAFIEMEAGTSQSFQKKTEKIKQSKPPSKPDINRIGKILGENKEKNFVQRILKPESSPSLDLGNGDSATHLMAYGEANGKFFVYPTVIDAGNGELRQLSDDGAWEHSQKTGEFIEFNREKDAAWFSENYKKWWDK